MAIATTGVAAAAESPRWHVVSQSVPTNFPPGATGLRYLLTVENVGAEAEGVTIEDVLPPGFSVTAASAKDLGSPVSGSEKLGCSVKVTVVCAANEPIPTGDFLAVVVTLDVSAGVASPATNVVNVFGGGVSASISEPTDVTSTVAGFGIKDFSARLEAEDGSEELVAGSHPFAFTTSLVMNTALPNAERDIISAGSLKDLEVDLPVGLIGNTQAVPKCDPNGSGLQGYLRSCPVASQVGVANVVVGGAGAPLDTFGGPFSAEVPVYNLTPSDPSITAEFGFIVQSYPILLTATLKGNETVAVHLLNSSETVPILNSSVTIWGVPSASAHDAQRFSTTGPREPGVSSNEAPSPFLTEPTACLGPLTSTLQNADSWQHPGAFLPPLQSRTATGVFGCDALSFAPTLSVRPSTTQADSPAAYSVALSVPQSQQADGLATSALRDATVTLPLGTALSPSAAGGLEACSDGEFAEGSESFSSCPPASQVGTVTVTTPVLAEPLQGQLFVAEPLCGNAAHPAPCGPQQARDGSLFRVFMQIEGPGIRVKLPGTVSVDTATGQLVTSFKEDPQLPFSKLELNLKGGPRAPIANSQACGEAQTTSELVPWSGAEAATPSSFFDVTGCGSRTPFAPGFTAGTVNAEAGRTTTFTTSLTRQDGERNLSSLRLVTPPGLLGMLSKVQPCAEPEASTGTCGPQSEIGHAFVAAGAGSQPFWTSGRIFLTTSYHGSPFGLSIVVPAVAGPFNLGNVVVRAAISVDPRTAAITVTSDPFPQMIDGVPLRVKDVEVSIDKAGFMLNPTNCAEQHITAGVLGTAVDGSGATTASVASRFAASGCSRLPFAPKLTAMASAKTSKLNGVALRVGATSGPGQANIGKVKVELPKQLPSRLTTLQKACRDKVFNINPAQCPAGSTVGTARAVTPILSHPLAGPAYLVSHGGAKFPDLVVLLQGEGITIELDGATTIKNGITTSTFTALPDAPVTSFSLALPAGPLSLLTAFLPLKAKHSLCGQKLAMPTILTGQNGAIIKKTTMIAISGCAPSKHGSKKGARKPKRHK
ncbi:MAG: hypothetical protein H0X28_02800 [Solirubrobacterales bacterium]|nr:hypothetical protein [Solirubrobacterales bacterium]